MYHSHLLSSFLRILVLKTLLFSLPIVAETTNTTDPFSGKPLDLLEVVGITLENSPNIKLQKLGVDMTKAQERIAVGTFDINTYVVAAYDNSRKTNAIVSQLKPEIRATIPSSFPDVLTNDHDVQYLRGGISKNFRTGISTDLSIVMRRDDPRQDSPLGQTPTYTENRTKVSFTVNIPLLQGSGYVSAAANETAARLNHEASLSDLQHFTTSALLNTIKAYWRYKEAVEFLKVQQRAEKRIQDWVNMVSVNDDSLQGYLEDKKGKVIDALQEAEESKIALANTMGIPADQVASLGFPVDDFPMDWSQVLATFDQHTMKNQWITEALEKRLDLNAAKLRLQAANVQLAKARNNVLPRLDLKLSAGYRGFTQYDGFDTYVDSFDSNVREIDSSAMLTLRYPFGNNTAKGAYDLHQAQYQTHLIKMNEMMRSLRLTVGDEVVNVYGRLQKVVQVRKTTISYQQSLKKMVQDERFLQDPVKLLTLIELENKLIESVAEYFKTLRDLANAIVQVRFKTGTLIKMSDTISDVTLENITTLPNL